MPRPHPTGPTRPRTRRPRAAILGAALLLATMVTPAQGWANNDDDYSTHDWFIDQAVRVLDGRAADWFDAGAARRASDDPDTIPALDDGLSHVYRETGLRGGAVQRVSEHYSAAVAHYRDGAAARLAGDAAAARASFEAASREIGLLSHYYTDILQPYHSASAGSSFDAAHHAYELRVDAVTRRASDSPDWHSPSRSVSTLTNVRTTAIAAAAYSRQFFADLHASFTANQAVLSTRVREITGKVARRGAQDLANIVWSVSRGVGESPAVASLRASVKWTYVAAKEPYQAVYVTARDAAGRPIEGLEVAIAWPKADGGTLQVRRYTDPAGVAKYVSAVGGGPLLVRRTVGATATATTPGAARTASTWFMATPRLADGRAGLKTVVRDATVVPGQTVFVTTLARDTASRPVPGLLVTWTWKYGTKTVVTKATTDDQGRARTSRVVSTRTTRSTVTVTAHVQAASQNRYASTSFRRVR